MPPSNNPTPSVPATAKPSVSPDFANFNNQFGASTSATRSSDFFDAFHDNFNKNTTSQPAQRTASPFSDGSVSASNGAAANNADLAFGGDTASGRFDPFGVPNDGGSTSSGSNRVDNAFAANFNSDFFANGFEDEFAKVKVLNANANVSVAANNQRSSSSSSLSSSGHRGDFGQFDAFGAPPPPQKQQQQQLHNKNGNNGFGAADPFADDNFGATAKVDDGFLTNAMASGASSTKKSNNNVGGGAGVSESLKNTRYAADYSQGETFDKDLQETLKRSMVDQ